MLSGGVHRWRGVAPPHGRLPSPTVLDGRPALAGPGGLNRLGRPRSEPRPGPPRPPVPPFMLLHLPSHSAAQAHARAPSPPSRISPSLWPDRARGAGVCRAICTSRPRACVNVMRSTRKHATRLHNSLSTPPLVSFPSRISSASHWSVPQSPHDRLVGGAPADQKSRPRVIGSLRADVGHRREPHA